MRKNGREVGVRIHAQAAGSNSIFECGGKKWELVGRIFTNE